MATRRQQKASATLSTAMATVATETHSDARWWPLTWREAGECSWRGRLGRGIWGIIWRLTKPLASWGGGQERERERAEGRGTERGVERTMERAPFSSCPLQREWPLTLCISLKSVHPPSRLPSLSLLEHRAQAAACPALAIQAQVQSTAEKKCRQREGCERNREWKRHWTYATARRKTSLSFYSLSFHLLLKTQVRCWKRPMLIKKVKCTDASLESPEIIHSVNNYDWMYDFIPILPYWKKKNVKQSRISPFFVHFLKDASELRSNVMSPRRQTRPHPCVDGQQH